MMINVVSLSGGMDSATVLSLALKRCPAGSVEAVSFTYGSKHNQYELAMARLQCEHYHINHRLIDLSGFMASFKSNLLKSGGDIPEGHYEAETMTQTVVPARNIIFSAILAGVGWSLIDDGDDEGAHIWLGVHSGDHAIYPDCRPDFVNAMNKAIRAGTGDRVALRAPFLYADKTKIIKQGLELATPYHLTRTCYKDQPVACGKCGSCQERLEAFANNNLDDPLVYDSRELMPKTTASDAEN